jgi:hypothetical protein
MSTGIPLVIEAEVSAMLLSAVRSIQDIYCLWEAERGRRLTRIEVSAQATVRPRQASSSAAFFSCGVDSFYTLLRNVRRYPPGDSRFIQELVLVHGFDIPLADRGLFEQVAHHAQNAAHHFGRHLMTVETNVRDATRIVDWGHYGHGAALASVGLALGRLVQTVFIPSTSAFVELRPWGSHPALDPFWSTEQVEFVHDGGEARRHEKIRVIASSTAALQALRVCWETRAGAYNCGRCEKCLRTMIELQMCGALERAAEFPRAIQATAVERLTIPPNCWKYWHRILDDLERPGNDALVVAIQAALRQSTTAPTRVSAGGIAGRLSQIGLTKARILAIDRRLFGGGLVPFLRRIQRRAASNR